jgi:DNA-binding NarL/FixJ family response regulator
MLIADDHEVYRDGLKLMLAKEKRFAIVGETGNGVDLVNMALTFSPDIILTEIKMPKADGIAATREIRQHNKAIGIIALSVLNEQRLIWDMLEAGAMGYLLKSADKSEILAAINRVSQGDAYYCQSTSLQLAIGITESRFHPYKKGLVRNFSAKEIEVIRLICAEYSTKEISEKISQSMRTIEGYRRSILHKMNARNTAGLVVYAIKNGIYSVGIKPIE